MPNHPPQPDQEPGSTTNLSKDAEKSAFYNPTGLIEVLRKRLAGLKAAYDGLEDYARSLEADRRDLHDQLEAAQTELKRWQANRGVRLGRTFALLGHNLQQSLAVSTGAVTGALNSALKARLDAPQARTTVRGELAVSGWVAGNVPATLQIEVWLGETRLGLAATGLPRWDVIESQPWQTRPDCGFAGRFPLEPGQFPAGKALLKVLFKDGAATLFQIERPLIVETNTTSDQQQLYADWQRRTGITGWDFLAQRAASAKWSYRPLITVGICPSQATDPAHLTALLESIQAQTYPLWEVRLQLPPGISTVLHQLAETAAREDERIQVQFSPAETTAPDPLEMLEAAQGDFVAWPAADALVSQDALFRVVEFLNQHLNVTLLYSDEDTLDAAGNRTAPRFKPDWSPEFFYSRPYLGQPTFYRRSVLKEAANAFEKKGEDHPETRTGDASFYDLTLRLLEKHGPFHHLPAVIYHSRQPLDLDQPLDPAYGTSLVRHFERTGLGAPPAVTVEPGLLPATLHYRPALPAGERPLVSLIIPTRDQSEVLRRCLDSVFRLTTYPNYEVIVVDNASHQAETHQYFTELAGQPRFRRLAFDGPFNFSAINNYAAAQAQGQLLVFLNNDTEVITPGWLEELAAFALQPEIGAVGARLLFPDNTVQHAGVVVGLLGIADHLLKGLPAAAPGPLGLAKTARNVSALTAACLMTRRELFLEVGGFDEENLPVAFNDVDLCLKLREKGLRLVWTPYAQLYHHESVSRGLDSSVEKEARLHREITYMFGRWPGPIARDPYYNPNLSRTRLDYTVSER